MLATEEIGSSSNKDWQWHKSQNPPGASAWPSVAPHLLRLSAQGGTSDHSDIMKCTTQYKPGRSITAKALLVTIMFSSSDNNNHHPLHALSLSREFRCVFL